MSPADNDVIEGLVERILKALKPADHEHIANVLAQDPAGLALSLRGVVQGIFDDALGHAAKGKFERR